MTEIDNAIGDILFKELQSGDLYRSGPASNSVEYVDILVRRDEREEPHKATFRDALSTLEGQTLYELYCNKALQSGWSPVRPLALPTRSMLDTEFVQWKALSPTQKGFWQELAQDFLKVAS